MAYDITWIIPRLRNPGMLWNCASSITVAVVGLFSKIIVDFLNKTTVYNREALQRAVRRPRDVPLLTVSNHHSCFDDPGLWGVLDAGTLSRGSRMRWSLAAHDICFTNALHSAFFALGKCVPVVRGAGVYQPAMDFCVERLCGGEWVHIFPEGRVNVDKQRVRFKWGVGRLVADSAAAGRAPLVLPVWHEGIDQVLPNTEPYRLRFRNQIYLAVGEPLPLSPLLDKLRSTNASEEETRRVITERIQEELMKLRDRTHMLIRHACGPDADGLLGESNEAASSEPASTSAAPPIANGKEKNWERQPETAKDNNWERQPETAKDNNWERQPETAKDNNWEKQPETAKDNNWERQPENAKDHNWERQPETAKDKNWERQPDTAKDKEL